ncbi:MAG TPA: glycosyltransferase family 39 protein [Candidatus Cloacimonadota bacterium]|nr:glycosyltransferase family 39 protein [Candidatus Cloacimonadota bacterium]
MSYGNLKSHFIRNEKLYLIAIMLFFFLFRLAYIHQFGNFDTSTFKDATCYNNYAKAVLHNPNWLTSKDFDGSVSEPVYPIFVAIIYSIFGEDNYFAVYVVQALISTILLLLLYQLTMIVVNRRLVALMSMIWAGFYLFYLRWIGEVLREVVIYFLLVLLFYQLALFFQREKLSIKHLILPSITYTLLNHTDGRYLVYAPFLIILFLINIKPFRKAVMQYILFGIMVIFLTIPRVVRNYIAYKEVIIVSELNINLSKSELSTREYLLNTAPIDSLYTTFDYKHNPNYPTEIERTKVLEGYNPNHRSNAELQAIKEGKRASKSWFGRKWYFFRLMWFPVILSDSYFPYPVGQFYQHPSVQHNILTATEYGLLLPFALLAMINGFIKRKYKYSILCLPIFIQMFIHFFAFGIVRYRVPIDGFLIILGCTGIVICLDLLYKQVRFRLPT